MTDYLPLLGFLLITALLGTAAYFALRDGPTRPRPSLAAMGLSPPRRPRGGRPATSPQARSLADLVEQLAAAMPPLDGPMLSLDEVTALFLPVPADVEHLRILARGLGPPFPLLAGLAADSVEQVINLIDTLRTIRVATKRQLTPGESTALRVHIAYAQRDLSLLLEVLEGNAALVTAGPLFQRDLAMTPFTGEPDKLSQE
ncbi:MAG TPA: hypothetical protein VG692_19150 [Gemmatimonadales bacterium]|nr:hypothetical protein [Gemmatimonadales bacterium]